MVKINNRIIRLYFTLMMMFVSGIAAHSQSSHRHKYPELKVIDEQTGNPIPYANVCFEELKTKKQFHRTTNNDGIAENPAQQPAIVAVSFVGYVTIKDTLRPEESKIYHLKPDLFNLDQVVVTGTRTPHSLAETPVLTQLITASEISKQGISTIKDVLEVELPGVEMGRHGFGTSMSMQGLEPQYTLILVDGERIAGESGGNVDFSKINTANIQQVEIIRGASSALYGSNAMGGVVNIITKKPSKKIDVSVKTHYSQRNGKDNETGFIDKQDENYLKRFYKRQDLQNLNTDVSLGYNNKKLYTNFYLGAKSYDGYQLYDKKGLSRKYLFNDSTVTDPVSTTPTNIKGFFDHTISNKTGYSFTPKTNAELRTSYYNHEDADFTKDGKHDVFKNYTLGGHVDHRFDSVSSVRLSHNYDNYNKYNVLEKLDDEARMNYRNIFNNTKLVFTTIVRVKHDVLLGLENFNDDLTTDMFTYGELKTKSANDAVVVVQDEYSITKKISIVAGARGGWHSAFNGHLSPSITAKIVSGKFANRLSYSRGYRSPSLKELYMYWDHQGMFTIIGSDDLEPETNDYISFSTDYLNVDKKINVTFISSYNQINNKIDGVWTNNQTEYHYVNFEQQKVFSNELLLKWKIFKQFNVKGGYAFTKLIMDKDVVNRSSISPHAITAQLDYQYQSKNYALGANVSGKITGKKEFNVLDEDINQYYQVSYPTYSLWNVSTNVLVKNKMNVEIGVKNIFDYTAPIVSFNSTPSPGRRFFTTLTYNF